MSRKFKILSIPNVLAYGKSYMHDFDKKFNAHKLCAKSSFDQFFMQYLKNPKYWPPNVSPWEVVRARFCVKI
ncbi:hypothetical protein B296_00039023 [Ensete ventricosum]|uniref:Uncharacterized protein n=1 Tax=Ensete ventricosum TaxID=4639 RepID=A0A426XZN0_ENSVE|nr:hypothetical protein B296_00039023 [Ensete ventricosum]